MWLKSKGFLEVDEKGGRIVVNVHNDFINYYNWHVIRHYKIVPQRGRFNAHITLAITKFTNKKFTVDWKKARRYHGRAINFEYNNNIIQGGQNSQGRFMNFWMHVRSEEIDKIVLDLNIKNDDDMHITLSSTKSGVVAWNGPTISINESKN